MLPDSGNFTTDWLELKYSHKLSILCKYLVVACHYKTLLLIKVEWSYQTTQYKLRN